MRFIWHSKTPHKIATFSGIGTMHLCKNHVSISSYSQQGVRPVSVAGRWSCLEKLRISYLWANFLCWVVWDVPCSLFLSLSLGSVENGDAIIRKLHKVGIWNLKRRMSAEDCDSEHSSLLWREYLWISSHSLQNVWSFAESRAILWFSLTKVSPFGFGFVC